MAKSINTLYIDLLQDKTLETVFGPVVDAHRSNDKVDYKAMRPIFALIQMIRKSIITPYVEDYNDPLDEAHTETVKDYLKDLEHRIAWLIALEYRLRDNVYFPTDLLGSSAEQKKAFYEQVDALSHDSAGGRESYYMFCLQHELAKLTSLLAQDASIRLKDGVSEKLGQIAENTRLASLDQRYAEQAARSNVGLAQEIQQLQPHGYTQQHQTIHQVVSQTCRAAAAHPLLQTPTNILRARMLDDKNYLMLAESTRLVKELAIEVLYEYADAATIRQYANIAMASNVGWDAPTIDWNAIKHPISHKPVDLLRFETAQVLLQECSRLEIQSPNFSPYQLTLALLDKAFEKEQQLNKLDVSLSKEIDSKRKSFSAFIERVTDVVDQQEKQKLDINNPDEALLLIQTTLQNYVRKPKFKLINALSIFPGQEKRKMAEGIITKLNDAQNKKHGDDPLGAKVLKSTLDCLLEQKLEVHKFDMQGLWRKYILRKPGTLHGRLETAIKVIEDLISQNPATRDAIASLKVTSAERRLLDNMRAPNLDGTRAHEEGDQAADNTSESDAEILST